MYLECVNDSNNVNKIKAIACIKIKSAWHTYYSIDSARMDDAGGFGMVVKHRAVDYVVSSSITPFPTKITTGNMEM